MPTLGLIADTHMPDRWPAVPATVGALFAGVDLILHAGDVGDLDVLDALGVVAPVVAVHGNDDSAAARRELPPRQVIAVAGRRILLWHSHYGDRIDELDSRRDGLFRPKLSRIAAYARRAGADIVVFGHWHVPLTVQLDGVWLINPGAIASGNDFTRQTVQSVARLALGEEAALTHHGLDGAPVPVHRSADGSFAVDGMRYSASLLAPDVNVAALRARLAADPTAYAAYRALAHRAWAGEMTVLTATDLASAIK